jgi:hypothetical protein
LEAPYPSRDENRARGGWLSHPSPLPDGKPALPGTDCGPEPSGSWPDGESP